MDDFVERINPDILLLQETRALPEQLPKGWEPPMPHTLLHPLRRRIFRSRNLVKETVY